MNHIWLKPVITNPNQTPSKFLSTQFNTPSNIASNATTSLNNRGVDFTDAHLVVQRNTEGKHIVDRIVLNSQQQLQQQHQQHQPQAEESSNRPFNYYSNIKSKSISNNSLNKIVYASLNFSCSTINCEEMNSIKNLASFKLGSSSNQSKQHHLENANSKTKQSLPHSISFQNSTTTATSALNNLFNTFKHNHHHHNNNLNDSTSSASTKGESIIKSKMKKFMTRTSNNSNANTQQAGLSIEARENKFNMNSVHLSPHQVTTGLLKFNRTNNVHGNDDILLENTPVYTETKLPPRILRKYQNRSNTEAVVCNTQSPSMNTNSDSSMNMINVSSTTTSDNNSSIKTTNSSENGSGLESSISSPNHMKNSVDDDFDKYFQPHKEDTVDTGRTESNYLASNVGIHNEKENTEENGIEGFDKKAASTMLASSPKPPPRIKKKYRRSKTTDIKMVKERNDDEDSLESDFSIENKRDCNNTSLDANTDNNETGSQLKSNKLDDSLDDSFNDSSQLEQDSLLANQSACNEKHDLSASKRALWDKSKQQVDFYHQTASNSHQIVNSNLLKKPTNNSKVNIATIDTQTLTKATSASLKKIGPPKVAQYQQQTVSSGKKARNLNLAKEKLYEMKKSIDAKANWDKINKQQQTVLFQDLPTVGQKPAQSNTLLMTTTKQTTTTTTSTINSRTTPRKVKKRSGERSVTLGLFQDNELDMGKINPIPYATSSRSHSPFTVINKTSSNSLHNLLNNVNDLTLTPNNRTRRDSYNSTTSSNYTHFSYTPAEYKENKASELRKKSNLMNKIISKAQAQNDPIFARNHPICSELHEVESMNTTNASINIGSYEQQSAARKRLFAKKNEAKYDGNLSFGSQTTTQAGKTALAKHASNKQPASTIKNSRSKSNNDLFYELERTNSTQDLIELMNNCEPPQGDVQKYKLMLAECEKYSSRKHLNRTSATTTPSKLSATRTTANTNKTGFNHNKTTKQQEKTQNSKGGSTDSARHKRSQSMPSYAAEHNIPIRPEIDQDDSLTK